MGVDKNERGAKPKTGYLEGPRIWLPLEVLQSRAFASLSNSGKALLLCIAAQLRGKGGIKNNGDLTTCMKVLKKYGWNSEKTIRAAAKNLEEKKLICKTRQGQLPNKPNLYAVTWLPLNEDDKLDITARGFPYLGYRLFETVNLNVNG